jgi:hypothetical protein
LETAKPADRAAIHIKGMGLEHFQPKRSRFGVGQCGKTKI